jgi:hypothetical protein
MNRIIAKQLFTAGEPLFPSAVSEKARTTIDESFRSLRKFSPVVFRPAVAGLLECARVVASLLGEKAVDRKAMRRRLAFPKHFVQDAVDAF